MSEIYERLLAQRDARLTELVGTVRDQRATIQQLETRLAESEKAAYDIDETIQHQKQTIEQLEAQLNDKDTVPRSRYNVCCDQYNEVRDSLINVRIVAKTEIQRLEARIKELESQRNHRNP